jgi:hypothetical protein
MKSSVNGDVKEKSVEAKPQTEAGMQQEELLGIVQDLQSKIARLEAKDEGDTQRSAPDTDGRTETIAADDFLEVPAIFFAYSTAYALSGDKRRNKYENAPGGEMIKFRKAYRYEKRSSRGRGVDIVSTCSVKVQSKQLAEWLRGHTLFGIKFFENMSEAANVDVSFAEKMSQVQGVISSMSDMQVIERARMIEGININTPDTDYIRKQLVEKIARKEMQGEKSDKVDRYVQGQGKQDKKIDAKRLAGGGATGDVY